MLRGVMSVRHLAHPERNLALLRELAGIAQEIEQNLLEPHGVCGERAQVLLRFDDEAVLVLLSELSRGTDDLIPTWAGEDFCSANSPLNGFQLHF